MSAGRSPRAASGGAPARKRRSAHVRVGLGCRAVIHSRMRVGMEKYWTQYRHSDVLLFEPDREDADMFFANILSYTHRAQLCETAYRNTRQRLRAPA